MTAEAIGPTAAPAVLRLREITKDYVAGGERIRAVDRVTLDISGGEVVALFGPSGSGKSTLLQICAAVLPPDSGSVIVGERDITKLSERDAASYRMHELGYVRQQIDLLEGATAVENAALRLYGAGLSRREAHRKVLPLLDTLGLAKRFKHRPDQLSMGERQRVMIARALSTEPRVLLADEPTGALDSQRKSEVLALLRDLTRAHDIATLLVTHDAHALDYADRAFVLEDGALQAHPDAPTPSGPR
ncbi:ABC transporter ATP-binding protein [Patulibacter defluvii]|uniref:ABC transporter ATP-binding protein n=1 Tax=Patulibacter defluvii TaxID=3095358 RepID=UPI002A74E1A3|nr:ABC transporter ATP-binding protein [Patulibacter sp. DM4]